MNRRRFLTSTAVLGMGSLALIACGADHAPQANSPAPNDRNSAGGACANGAAVNYLNPGHPHVMVALTQSQVSTAIPGVYVLLGGSHSHTFTLSPAHFASLLSGEIVTGLGDNEGHGHLISITC